MRKLHLADISKHVGFSKTLCSMVLNGKGNKYGISKRTQEQVVEAAKTLRYTPNKYAKSLRTGKSYFIGLVVTDIANPFYSTIAKSIESMLYKSDYSLMICSSEESEEREKQLVEMMISQQGVDGLIVTSTFSNPSFYEHPRFKNVPIVFIDRVVPLFRANYIVIDNYGGSLEIVQHLIKEGCRRIACLAVTPLHLSTIEDRISGYKTALRNAGVLDAPDLMRPVRFDSIEEDVEKHLQEFLLSNEKLDAIFALNNHIAIAILKLLRKREFLKYSRVKLACFDDLELFNMINRKVVSVSQPVEQIGRTSCSLILEMLNGKKVNRYYHVLSPTLIER
jgi:LacI family transcriptional regulator